ncbi:patatin-like protein 7 [Carex littledalei]|uniref:Patatin n=1 Tax=Carex littledalei TaxID=544730 RepID=A0A833V751_9POAL|nr:patatin-like protein 7 [Carex littledalei]
MEPPAEEMVVEVHDTSHLPGSLTTDKLSYEIFSILESKFLFGYTTNHPDFLHVPRNLSPVSSPPKPSRRKVCILSIDGAGLRCIVAAKALAQLESSLQSISGNAYARISDFFDLVAGSGSGGVLAGMLLKPEKAFRPDDMWRFLVERAPLLFPKPNKLKSFFSKNPLKASTSAMEKTMKEAFGEDASLRDTIKPLLVPCYNLNTSGPFVFSRADAVESESFNFRLWEVGRATWAEPGRFEPAPVRSCNGSESCFATSCHVMSNPCAVGITHVLNNKMEFPFVRGVEDLLVLSIGCGCMESCKSVEVDLRKVRKWEADKWAHPVARVVSDGAADIVDQSVAMAFGQCQSSGYVRIQGNCSSTGIMGADVDCDPRPENINTLQRAAEDMLRQKHVSSVLFKGKRVGERSNMEMLDMFARELVLEHNRF